AQQRRLAASRRPHQHDEFAVVDEDVDAVDDLERSKGLSDVADRDRSHGLLPSRGPCGRPSEARPRALFALRPHAPAAMAGRTPGPAIGGDYRGNFNSPLLAIFLKRPRIPSPLVPSPLAFSG